MNRLLSLDHWLFDRINDKWSCESLDWFFTNLTDFHKNPAFVVLLILGIGFWFYKQRLQALKWVLVLGIAVSATDLFSYRVIKSLHQRSRPEFVDTTAIVRSESHTGPSFPSNHSANMFASASVMSAAIPPGAPIFFLIAASVAYSRIYVGVHFPIDVLAGALLGLTIAFLIKRIFSRFTGVCKHEGTGYWRNRISGWLAR